MQVPVMSGITEPAAEQITLATIRQWAERTARLPAGTEHGKGYERAARDVLAILDMNGKPIHEPVVFPARD